MAIRKIQNSWWVDLRFRGDRYRKRSPDNSRAGAAAYEATLRSRLAKGESIAGQVGKSGAAFRVFAGEWLETYAKTNNKPAEFIRKESVLRTGLVPFFERLKLEEITDVKIEQYKASKLHAGLAAKSVNNHLTVLSKCLKCAVEWGVLERIPRIRLLKTPPEKFDFLTFEESERLLAVIHDAIWYGMTLAALRTGMRAGELMALDWSDVNLQRGTITVRRAFSGGVITAPKSHRERHIPIARDLMDWFAAMPSKHGFVFQDAGGSRIIHGRSKRALHGFCKTAGIRPVGWHALRHSFASQLTMKNVPSRTVQLLMGHSDLRTTMRYSHLAPSAMTDAINLLASPEIEKFGQQVGNEIKPAYVVETRVSELLRSTKRKSQALA